MPLLCIADFSQYEFLPEAIDYATNEMVGAEVFSANYFESVVYKLADSKYIGHASLECKH